MSTVPAASPENPVVAALRVALASVACLVICARFELEGAYQSVMTVHIINMAYTYGPFQRGLERFLGRVSGVVYGAVVAVVLSGWPGLIIAFVVSLQLVVWYMGAAGRLPYASLHLGVFSATTAATGLFEPPNEAIHTAITTATQIMLGVAAAELTNFLIGVGGPFRLDLGKNPLFPLRLDCVMTSVRVTLAGVASMVLAHTLGLPLVPTMSSTMIIAQVTDTAAAEWKAYLRALGATAGVVYSIPILHLLAQVPAFGLVLGFMFLGVVIGQLVNRTMPTYAYFGQQFGMAVAIILSGRPAEVSDLEPGYERMIGVVGGTAVAVVSLVCVPTLKRQ